MSINNQRGECRQDIEMISISCLHLLIFTVKNVIYGCELTLIVADEAGSVAKVLVTLDNLLLSIIVTFETKS